MRKIKLYIASSLDSFIADENGNIDWLFSEAMRIMAILNFITL